jgi:hypothetical protein
MTSLTSHLAQSSGNEPQRFESTPIEQSAHTFLLKNQEVLFG